MKLSYTLYLLVLINLSLKTSSGHYSNESTAADDTLGINQVSVFRELVAAAQPYLIVYSLLLE